MPYPKLYIINSQLSETKSLKSIEYILLISFSLLDILFMYLHFNNLLIFYAKLKLNTFVGMSRIMGFLHNI